VERLFGKFPLLRLLDRAAKLTSKPATIKLALPGSDDSIRGLTVGGWIIADEAARLSEELIAAPNAGPPAGGALCDAIDGLEPDRPVLDHMEQG